MRIILAQTAAGPAYEAMLAATAPLHGAYCDLNRVEFLSTAGVRRGFHLWQACYNRIEILHDLLEAGFDGWFFYLDADAVICQPGFGLRRYLGKRTDYALIAAPGRLDGEHWDINDGIFFLNLDHPLGREIAQRWHRAFHEGISDEMLQGAVEPWRYPDGSPFPGDQHLLQMLLKDRPYLAEALLREDGGLINYGKGRFIRQFLRAVGTPEERLAAIRETVAAATPG